MAFISALIKAILAHPLVRRDRQSPDQVHFEYMSAPAFKNIRSCWTLSWQNKGGFVFR
jgi:hypothetical protein